MPPDSSDGPARDRRTTAVAFRVAGLSAVIAVAGTVLWLATRSAPSPVGILLASGRVEADEAALGAAVGGRLTRITVDESDHVEAGALLAEIDSAPATALRDRAAHLVHVARQELDSAQVRVRAAERRVEAARIAAVQAERDSRAQVGEAEAALGVAEARLREARAERERANADERRYRDLAGRGAVSVQVLDQAVTARQVVEARVESAEQQIAQARGTLERARATDSVVELRRKEVEAAQAERDQARAAVDTAHARIETESAGLDLAESRLADTRVQAPFPGTVLERLAEPGEVVAAGTPLLVVADLGRLHAVVYVEEAQIGRVALGARARVYVDAYPGRAFEARVARIAQRAEFTPRDVHMPDERTRQVFAVELGIENPTLALKPGMPVDARIRLEPDAAWGDGLP